MPAPDNVHIPEYHDEDAFPVEERDLPDHKLNWRGIAGEGKEPDSSADRGTTRTELQELRHRIRSDPPCPSRSRQMRWHVPGPFAVCPSHPVGCPAIWTGTAEDERRVPWGTAEAATSQERRYRLTDVSNIRLEGDPAFLVATELPRASQKSSMTDLLLL